MKLSDTGIKVIKNYMIFVKNQEKENVSKILIDLFSLPIIEEKSYYYKENLATFFNSDARESEWNYYMRNMVDVEYFFGVVLYLTDKEKWKMLEENHQLHELERLYESLGLSNHIKKELFPDFREGLESVEMVYEIIFRIWYSARYIDNTKLERIRGDLYEPMMKCLISVYADVIQKRYKELSMKLDSILVEKSVNLTEYCQNVVDKYNINYVELKWKKTQKVSKHAPRWEAAGEIILKTSEFPNDLRLTKLVGVAGIGKTTTLKYLQYKACKSYLDDMEKNDIKVPIYVELRKARECFRKDEQGEELLKRMIKKALGVENENLDIEPILKSGKVCLYLDGYNEVSSNRREMENYSMRDKVKSGIIEISKNEKYDELFVTVTDRVDDTQPAYWIENDKNPYSLFELIPLEDEEILGYFKVKFKEEKDKKYLDQVTKALDKTNGALNWMYGRGVTPFFLEKVKYMVMGCVDNKKEDELEFMGHEGINNFYMESILKREESQKSEEGDAEELLEFRKWLRMLAEKGMIISDTTAKGNNKGDATNKLWTKFYNKAVQMHIIEKVIEEKDGKLVEKGCVCFVEKDYKIFCATWIDEEGII